MSRSIKFRKLAFELQLLNDYKKKSHLIEMIRIMNMEENEKEINKMNRTICANIKNHNIVFGIPCDGYQYRNTSSISTN